MTDKHAEDGIYEVQAIINHRYTGPQKKVEYLTTWVGYPDEQTWQSPADFSSDDAIKKYWKQRNTGENPSTNNNKRKSTNKESNTRIKRTRNTKH